MKKVFSMVLICIIIISFCPLVFAEETEAEEVFYTGLDEMTDEELEEFHSKLPRIVDVKPNSIALARMQEDETVLFNNVEVAEIGEEIVYAMPGEDVSLLSDNEDSNKKLPSAVDVSESLTFPPIGDQGETGSCTLWSLFYYQLTNNNCVVRGLQAKTAEGEAVLENIIAPGFLYSLLNCGSNSGTSYEDAVEGMLSYGCPNADKYELTMTKDSIKQWCTDTETWYDAMYNKPECLTYIDKPTAGVVDKNNESIVLVKKTLANGYVVSFSTYVVSWEFTTNSTDNKSSCRYMNDSQQGPHSMAIVGYDDEFWIDVNGNESEDEGEKGAFKVANSWGFRSSDFPDGYAWISYDAFGAVSGVEGAPTDREPVSRAAFYEVKAQKHYTPLLVAEVELTTTSRNCVTVQFGISDISKSEPSCTTFVTETHNAAFFNAQMYNSSASNVNFSGIEDSPENVIIPFDLTRLLKNYCVNKSISPKTPLRLYIGVFDEAPEDEYAVAFGEFSIVEPITNRKVVCSNTEDVIIETFDDYYYKVVDFEITPFVGCFGQKEITVNFNSDINEESVEGNIYWVAPDNDVLNAACEVIDNAIKIVLPEEFEYDSKYELRINQGIQSMGGNSLCSDSVLFVYMLNTLDVIDVWKEPVE